MVCACCRMCCVCCRCKKKKSLTQSPSSPSYFVPAQIDVCEIHDDGEPTTSASPFVQRFLEHQRPVTSSSSNIQWMPTLPDPSNSALRFIEASETVDASKIAQIMENRKSLDFYEIQRVDMWFGGEGAGKEWWNTKIPTAEPLKTLPKLFGGPEQEVDARRGPRTLSPPDPLRPLRPPNRGEENDYAIIDRHGRVHREISTPATARNVQFIEGDVHGPLSRSGPTETGAFIDRAHLQYRPRGQPGRSVGPTTRGAPTSSVNQLDEATLDLLRLSQEPYESSQPRTVAYTSSKRASQPSDQLPKSASTSSMSRVVKTQDGGKLRLANVFTWDDKDQSSSGQGVSPIPPSERSSRSSRLSPEAMRRNETGRTQSESRKRKTETVVEYETKKKAPPVIRTTVEGRLKMEKIVGADLITVDSCISSAWTVRDTVTNYKIKTTIGKKSLILQELKDGQSKYKISLIENGETIMEREAQLDIPDFMNKKEYLSEVSQRLLKDLQQQAGEQVSALTHVEIEVVEDVTNILKTYVIGERADDYLAEDQVAMYYEENKDITPPVPPIEKTEKIYVDVLEKDAEKELEKAEYQMMKEGQRYEDEGVFRRIKRMETEEESLDRRSPVEPRCAHVFADCDLTRKEDSSTYTVKIAIPLVHVISFLLRRTRTERKLEKKTYDIVNEGQRFEGEQVLTKKQRYDTESMDEEEEMRKKEVKIVQQEIQEVRIEQKQQQQENEAPGAAYQMEVESKHFEGEKTFRHQGRAFDSESSEERFEYRENEAQGGQYELSVEGISLRGETRFGRKGRAYESESEESVELQAWQKGWPTQVDLVKRESNSLFSATFETARIGEPQYLTVKRIIKKKEVANVICTIRKGDGVVAESTSCLWKEKELHKMTYRTRELAEEYANSTIVLDNSRGEAASRGAAERNWAGKEELKIKGRFRETAEEQAMLLYSFENANKTTRYETETIRRDKQRAGGIHYHTSEFRQTDEHCAVMLKTAGGAAASASTTQAEPVTDVRVRRKDAAAEIHAYILYKRILGNYAQASKRLAGLYQMKAAERKEERRLAESVRHFQAAGEYRQESSSSAYVDVKRKKKADQHEVIGIQTVEPLIGLGRLQAPVDQTYRVEHNIESRSKQLIQSAAEMQASNSAEWEKALEMQRQEEQRLIQEQRIHQEQMGMQYVTMGSREEHIRIEQQHARDDSREGIVRAERTAEWVGSTAQLCEPMEETAIGFWDTDDTKEESQKTFLTKSKSFSEISRSLQAYGHADISFQSSFINYNKSQSSSLVRKTSLKESARGQFRSEQHERQIELIKEPGSFQRSISLSHVPSAVAQGSAKQIGESGTALLATTGRLVPPREQSEAREIAIKQSMRAATGASYRAFSTENVSISEGIVGVQQRSHGTERVQRVKRSESQTLRTRASSQESISHEAKEMKSEQRRELEIQLQMPRRESIDRRLQEVREVTAVGFWSTAQEDAQQVGILPGNRRESESVMRAVSIERQKVTYEVKSRDTAMITKSQSESQLQHDEHITKEYKYQMASQEELMETQREGRAAFTHMHAEARLEGRFVAQGGSWAAVEQKRHDSSADAAARTLHLSSSSLDSRFVSQGASWATVEQSQRVHSVDAITRTLPSSSRARGRLETSQTIDYGEISRMSESSYSQESFTLDAQFQCNPFEKIEIIVIDCDWHEEEMTISRKKTKIVEQLESLEMQFQPQSTGIGSEAQIMTTSEIRQVVAEQQQGSMQSTSSSFESTSVERQLNIESERDRLVGLQLDDHERSAIGMNMQQSQETSMQGFWRTAGSEFEMTGANLPQQQETQLGSATVRAPLESHSQQIDVQIGRDIREDTQQNINLPRSDSTERKFGIEQGENNVTIEKSEMYERKEQTFADKQSSDASAKARELSSETVQLQSTSSILKPPSEGREEASKIITDSRLLENSAQMKAPQDSSISADVLLREKESDSQQIEYSRVVQIQEQSSLSGRASTERAIETMIGFVGDSIAYEDIERTQMTKTLDSTSQRMHESQEESIQGFWKTGGSESEIAGTNLPDQERKREFSSVKAPIETSIQPIDVQLGRDVRESSEHKIGLPRSDSTSKNLEISRSDRDIALGKSSEFESQDQTLCDRKKDEASFKLREFSREEVQTKGVSGILRTPSESREEVSKIITDSRNLEGSATMKASVDSSISAEIQQQKGSDMRQTEFSQVMKVQEQGSLSGRASTERQIDTNVGFVSSAIDSSETDISKQDQNIDRTTRKLQESREDNVHGFFRTASHEESAAERIVPSRGELSIAETAQMKASTQSSTSSEQSLEKRDEEICEGAMKLKPQESGRREFSIERAEHEGQLQKICDQLGEVVNLPSSEFESEEASGLRQAYRSSVSVMGTLGNIVQIPIEKSAEFETTISQKRSFEGQSRMRASEFHESETSFDQSRPEDYYEAAQIRRDISESDISFTGQGMKLASIDSDSHLTMVSKQDSADREVVFKENVGAASRVSEPRDESIMGFWQTSDRTGHATHEISESVTLRGGEASVKASSEFVTDVEASLKRSVSESQIQSSVKLSRSDSATRSFEVDEEEKSVSLSRGDSLRTKSHTVTLKRSDSAGAVMREQGRKDVHLQGVIDTLRAPKQQREEAMKIIKERRLIRRSASLSASREEISHTSMSKTRPDEEGSASFRRKIAQTQKTGFRSRASIQRELNAMMGFENMVPREFKIEGLRKCASTDKLSARFKESQEVNFHGFWKTHRAESTSALMFEIGESITNQVKMLTKASQENLARVDKSVSKISDEECKKTISERSKLSSQRSFSIERVDSSHKIKDLHEEEVGVKADLKESVRDSVSSQPLREISETSAQLQGIVSTLTSLVQKSESSSKIVEDKRLIKDSASLEASKESTSQTDIQKMKPEESSEASHERKILEKQTSDLTSRASEQRDSSVTSKVSSSTQNEMQAQIIRKSQSSDRVSSTMKESGYESLHSLWRSVDDSSESSQFIEREPSETVKDLIFLKTIPEQASVVESSFDKISEEVCERKFGESQKESDQRSLSIEEADLSQDIRQPQDEAIIDASLQLKDSIRESVISQQPLQELGETSTQLEGIVSTLTALTQRSESSSKIVDDRRLLQDRASMSESKEENIDLNLRQRKYDQSEELKQRSNWSENERIRR
ncbi:hypothetical protein WR25_04014 [Diploscapter pachys]|uniref:Uncharacterized protein n=1 Tax=Diploscapter pachys TaxID=2018661 RepID=A0A2A2JAA1_9BILA|nr:hypothetical protein WR25_04014 [Diploscapter pachys]